MSYELPRCLGPPPVGGVRGGFNVSTLQRSLGRFRGSLLFLRVVEDETMENVIKDSEYDSQDVFGLFFHNDVVFSFY